MNSTALGQFIALLEDLAQRPGGAAGGRARLELGPEQGACLWILYQEFEAAFSYQPGRTEALPLILGLARKLAGYADDAPLRMYQEPEWSPLITMRGPVENVSVQVCRGCQKARVTFGTSPFLDESSAVCDACGAAFFQSDHDERPLPPCDCGGVYKPQSARCLSCGERAASVEHPSPYQYFASRSWRRRDA